MSSLRQFRRRCTSGIVHGAASLAPFAPDFAINFSEWLIGRAGPVAPRLAEMVRQNMKSAGVYDPEIFRRHFGNIARHLTNGLRVLSNGHSPEYVRELARRDIQLDASVESARSEIEQTKGGLIAPAHCVNYLVSLVRLNESVPISIYLRWSKDERRIDLKRRWCAAAGLDVIIEPAGISNPAARAELIIDAIRSGKTVAITPDLAQRAGEGVPIRWMGRIAHLPSGPASLAMLAEVPVLPLFARHHEGRQILYFANPIRVTRLTRSEGGRAESVRRAMQLWSDGFERFIRECPDQWFLWGDNRWTRVLQGDPAYSSSVDSLE